MLHGTSRRKNTARQRREESDPLEEVEEGSLFESSKKAHEKAEKPTRFPKKIRSNPKESYRPMHKNK